MKNYSLFSFKSDYMDNASQPGADTEFNEGGGQDFLGTKKWIIRNTQKTQKESKLMTED